MTQVPEALFYTPTHEWVRVESDNIAVIGITDHAQQLLGDLVLVDFPELETQVTSGEESAVVESVKAASDVFSPLTGEVIECNVQLEEKPELVNHDPYGDGWLFKIRMHTSGELESLLDSESYQQLLAETV